MRGRFYPFMGTGITIPIIMIVFGFLIIIFPQIIAWLIGLYLIINGILILTRQSGMRRF